MIKWLKGLFTPEKVYMVGVLRWTINWSDIGAKESGYFQLFESESGRRSFDITNKAMLTSKSEHPGYGSCVVWANGGLFPSNATRVHKGEIV